MKVFIYENILNYRIQKQIGIRVFHQFYRAIHVSIKLFVLFKIFNLFHFSQDQKSSLSEEINVCKFLYHPFIADCLDYLQFESFSNSVIENILWNFLT
jgi:serine/threonine protein kinase